MLPPMNRFLSFWKFPTVILFLMIGVGYRFYHITQSDFLFYDEGYYMNENWRLFVEYIASHHPENFSFSQMLRGFYGALQVSLGSGKALWLFLINSRVFFGLQESWYFPRILSAFFGCLTLGIVYLFAKRYYHSSKIGILSMILLAVLPSHVFYSRLAMQEALSTLCLLLGFYFYLFPPQFHGKTFLSSLFFVLAYFSNYRLIILPILVAFCETYHKLSLNQIPNFRKYLWNSLSFLLLIAVIGNLDQGQHFKVILPWMFHQSHLAQDEPFHWYNLLSYPYYTFKFEGFLFGLFFWGNLYLIFKRNWCQLFPFFLCLVQMGIFSFAEEKGARYICVIYPFMVMSVASLLVHIFEKYKDKVFRFALAMVFSGMILLQIRMSWQIAHFQSDYRKAMEFLTSDDREVKLLTSQKWIMNLYTDKIADIKDLPYTFPHLLKMSELGFQYLVLDPQAYVSWTEGNKRFSLVLTNYLGFLDRGVSPIKVFPHLNKPMLERFVFEHNKDLLGSLEFLRGYDHLGSIRIYDLKESIQAIITAIKKSKQKEEHPVP